jgi:hypothetical protein
MARWLAVDVHPQPAHGEAGNADAGQGMGKSLPAQSDKTAIDNLFG